MSATQTADRTPRQCEGCAFKCGAAANREPNNYIKGQLAALGGFPFYCHDAQDWQDPASHKLASRSEVRTRGIRICAGWKSEVGRLARQGYFRGQITRFYLQALAFTGLDSLTIYLHEEDGEEKREAFETLKRVFSLLNRRRNKARKGTLNNG